MPKRYGQLWDKITCFENLLCAFKKARKGKRHKHSILHFSLNLEKELLSLQEQLQTQSYRPGDYRLFTIYERKPRLIAAAPFRDRVVHHALLNIIEPLIDRRFITHSYACRKNKGVHQAVTQYQKWSKLFPYVLKMDIRQYFPSIDHLLLKEKIARCIKDKETLQCLDLIIDHSPNYKLSPVWYPGDLLYTPFERTQSIPIGNLTSQFFANLYLNDFDHYIKEQLHIKAYLRYVDDFFVLAHDKKELHHIRQQISEYLATQRLQLHPCKQHIMPTRLGVDILGYRVFPHKRLLRNDNGHRFARRMRGFAKAYALGKIDMVDIRSSVHSWIGHAQHADTLGLRKKLFNAIVFHRGVYK